MWSWSTCLTCPRRRSVPAWVAWDVRCPVAACQAGLERPARRVQPQPLRQTAQSRPHRQLLGQQPLRQRQPRPQPVRQRQRRPPLQHPLRRQLPRPRLLRPLPRSRNPSSASNTTLCAPGPDFGTWDSTNPRLAAVDRQLQATLAGNSGVAAINCRVYASRRLAHSASASPVSINLPRSITATRALR